jgi:hypothetical protein
MVFPGSLHMNKPMLGFGMDAHLGDGMFRTFFKTSTQHEMPVDAQTIVATLSFA